MRLPNPRWKQPNNSDKFGNVWRTKNINFDLEGYAQLSPRMVRLYSDVEDSGFGLPLSFGNQATGEFQTTTTDSNWQIDLSTVSKSIEEDDGASNPTTTVDSDGAWFQGLWHVSTATAVLSRPATGGPAQEYTSRITGLTSGKRHIIEIFKSRVQICVSNGNLVKQYTSAYVAGTDLTIPSDYEISGMAYNADRMGIITRLANDGTLGQDQEAQFFYWNGSTTGAVGYGLGSDAGIGICAYQSSFMVLNRLGQLLYWNGGGFEHIASFPFYFTEKIFGDVQSNTALGYVYMETVGDTILINIGNEIEAYNQKGDMYMQEFPAGVWCYDPQVGLYHKYSLSNSPIYLFIVTSENVNTSTSVLTISAGTVPATGNVARALDLAGIGGLIENYDYYIIKVTDTTLKLATTRENAEAGIAIDLTSATAGSNYLWVLDHKDYGTTSYETPGAMKPIVVKDNSYSMFTDIIAGGRIQNTDVSNNDSLCIGVPWFKNKGLIETPKIFAEKDKATPQGIGVRFRPLNADSSIVVYGRTKDILGFPSMATSATWSGQDSMYVTHDLSEAKTFIESGGSILMEIVAGSGSGNHVLVESITSSDDLTYAITLKEDVFGVVAGEKCDFMLLNYEKIYTITDDDNDEGSKEVSADLRSSKFSQYLLELIGYDIVIEDVSFVSVTHQE